MDGAPKEKAFPMDVFVDPNLVVHDDKVDDYVPIWPCTHDHIHIEVIMFYFKMLV